MKIVSWNVNGIRACYKKGFSDFLKSEAPDICCIQETKAQLINLEEELINPAGYNSAWFSAERKGYSGVAIFTKIKPQTIIEGIGIPEFDSEGRVIMAEFEDFVLFNVYFPNGQMNETRLNYKLNFYAAFFNHCAALRAEGKEIIVCGDFNTAHQEIDLANPKENANYSGFLPIEREWLSRIIEDGYVDTFRYFSTAPQQYTWWTYRFGARKRNIGWRIDYFFATSALMNKINKSYILPDVLGSDHCPIVLEINSSN